jgi:non-ribosomal peptide synthetase component F
MAEESRARAFGARFEDVARRLPHKAAIVEDGHAIDYATLESTSRAIAARIEAAAAGRSGFAALLFSRKTTTVQAMVASLRCGRAYVPLDGGDPDERLGFVLRDGAPAILLTDRTLAARARSLAGATCAVVEIDGDERPDPAFALPEVAPDALAYVLYTSGSTGSPKGVTQTQRGIMFFADAFVRRLSLGEADRLSLRWTMSFAAANMHVYGGLLIGATVCAYDLRRDGIGRPAQWLDRERVTAIHAFSTVFRGLCATLPPGAKLRHVRVIDIGRRPPTRATQRSSRRTRATTRSWSTSSARLEADCIAQHVVSHGDPPPRTPSCRSVAPRRVSSADPARRRQRRRRRRSRCDRRVQRARESRLLEAPRSDAQFLPPIRGIPGGAAT